MRLWFQPVPIGYWHKLACIHDLSYIITMVLWVVKWVLQRGCISSWGRGTLAPNLICTLAKVYPME